MSLDTAYEQLMKHGRHVERERAWLLNFYIIVLSGFIHGLLEGHFTQETFRLASLIFAIFLIKEGERSGRLTSSLENIIKPISSHLLEVRLEGEGLYNPIYLSLHGYVTLCRHPGERT